MLLLSTYVMRLYEKLQVNEIKLTQSPWYMFMFFLHISCYKTLPDRYAWACRGVRCEAALSPTFSARHFSSTFGAAPKSLSATPNFRSPSLDK